jgi:hypothetical protein
MRLNLARGLIGLVILWNLQAAAVFLIWPERYIAGFELQGIASEAMLRGLGVLFVMWNVPYAVALWHPVRYRISLYESLAMQIIGLVGETAILLSVSSVYAMLRTSISRFILFDIGGLILLVVAAVITRVNNQDEP